MARIYWYVILNSWDQKTNIIGILLFPNSFKKTFYNMQFMLLTNNYSEKGIKKGGNNIP